MEIVENILLVDSSQTYKLYAKTGWTARVDSQIGWYVGFVKAAEDTWIFALNIDINENKDAANREGITREILKMEKLIN
jgi:beta-lactamase class D